MIYIYKNNYHFYFKFNLLNLKTKCNQKIKMCKIYNYFNYFILKKLINQ